MTPEEIESTTKRELRTGPFPYDDCRWLKNNKGANEDFIPDLDYYFSSIVGFAITASRLEQRDRQQLQSYWPYLKLSFFERYSKHKLVESGINETDTPKLYRQLYIAEQIRVALLVIFDQLLSTSENRKAI
jgi:hypothetical protein